MQNNTEKKSLESVLAHTISKQRLVILIAAGVVVLSIILIIIVGGIKTKKYDNSMNNLYSLEMQMQNVNVNDTDDENVKKTNDLINELDALSSASNKYPNKKASLDLASIYYDKKDYAKAIEILKPLVSKTKNTYLEQVALINLAVAYEDNNEIDNALETYQKLWDTYSKNSVYSSKALFALARIYDTQNNLKLAKATFKLLIDEFPQSEYAKVAENRLATLK